MKYMAMPHSKLIIIIIIIIIIITITIKTTMTTTTSSPTTVGDHLLCESTDGNVTLNISRHFVIILMNIMTL
jgi:hypothetical protein